MFYNFISKDSILYRLILCFGIGIGTVFGLSPFSFFSAGVFASISCIFLFFPSIELLFGKLSCGF
ncbi:hypothetical protein LEP1GSC151_1131 [Leptospira interrogans serovar Grippotyphosa str. LT2186]|uniref:Uncharacterized protein n=1 Tax=Leptospira interrogans serovar Grippotyphosa str. LT2186 TaxID=1001599 RepID=M3FWK7_LEPIR|nr:hypothetical protein LEP1GSC148_4209 [Leptospira interrogans serovar Canicola str. LT1962]EMG11819.1 hypothetical protein LEP1GSC151_1131 [Leptospira interrogans serovar Grippotyphosa str. LT2186]